MAGGNIYQKPVILAYPWGKKTHFWLPFFSPLFFITGQTTPLPNVPFPRNKGFHSRPKLKETNGFHQPCSSGRAIFFLGLWIPIIFSTWISERDLGKIFKSDKCSQRDPQPVERSFARHLVGKMAPSDLLHLLITKHQPLKKRHSKKTPLTDSEQPWRS